MRSKRTVKGPSEFVIAKEKAHVNSASLGKGHTPQTKTG